jgi:cytochrome c oxidase assembly protein subunit 15
MFDAWRHRFALLTAGATLFLIFAGGMVTSTGSGLAVPDWPLSYGMLMPPMVGGIFYEHGHRMVAAGVGLLTLALALWTARREPRPGVRRLAWAALVAVVAQGLLGGLTVLLLLPTSVSVGHACLAQAFLCITVALAYVTSREWLSSEPREPDVAGLRPACSLALAAVLAQLMLGAFMRHLHAGLAIPDFPLALGRLVPPFERPGVALHFAHRAFALLVLAALCWAYARARRSGELRLQRGTALALGLALLQIVLGATAVLSARAALPTSLHVVTGAALLGACTLCTLRAFRLLGPEPPPAPTIAVLRAA